MGSVDPLKIAAVQFEMAENDKAANLVVMDDWISKATEAGCHVVSFPELCTAGYHFLTQSPQEQVRAVAESVTDGPTIRHFTQKARETGMAILFGMLEHDDADDRMYNTYVVVHPQDGFIFKHRKIHAFENSCIHGGDALETFNLFGWTCGVLTCYDNNLPENNRVMALKGAELVFAPHQTGGFDIERAGMGRIPLELWQNRHRDPRPMREAIMGPKGYQWIMKWLPSRAYDNSMFTVFTNGVGIDGPEVRTGCSMILDPEGIVKAQTTKAEDDMVVAWCYRDELKNTLGGSHMAARKPSLYSKLTEPIDEHATREVRNLVSNETII